VPRNEFFAAAMILAIPFSPGFKREAPANLVAVTNGQCFSY
jgi:hypothetical protein